MRRWINKFLLVCLLYVSFGCEAPQELQATTLEETPPYEELLENAVLVCRLGNGYFSKFFKKYASKEQKYSHIGIVSKEKNGLFVYHAEANEFTGQGLVRKEPLDSFLNNSKKYDFFTFQYHDSIKDKIIEEVKEYYFNKTPFDLNFDSFNDEAVYCTELIALGINKATESEVITPNIQMSKKEIYGLDAIYLNENVRKLSF